MTRADGGLLRRLNSFAPIAVLRRWRYERSFASRATNQFRGVFKTFEEAMASAPPTKATGFNVPEFEGYFDERHQRLFLYDYPILFWLNRILHSGARVFDLGGNTGVHYTAYSGRLSHWAQIYWEVCEVPLVAEAGRRYAAAQGLGERLTFTSDWKNADGSDCLLSAGTLQYIDVRLADMLRDMQRPPANLLLNKVPLYDGEEYVTLQNGGVHFIAQQVYNRERFVGELESLGYQLVDHWFDNSRSCRVPFHPERDVGRFSGLFLSRHRSGV